MTLIEGYEFILSRIGKSEDLEKSGVYALISDKVKEWCRDLEIPRFQRRIKLTYGVPVYLKNVSQIVNVDCCNCEGQSIPINFVSTTSLLRINAKHKYINNALTFNQYQENFNCLKDCCGMLSPQMDLIAYDKSEAGNVIYPLSCDCCEAILTVVVNDIPTPCEDMDEFGIYQQDAQSLKMFDGFEDGVLYGVIDDVLTMRIIQSPSDTSAILAGIARKFSLKEQQIKERVFSLVNIPSQVI